MSEIRIFHGGEMEIKTPLKNKGKKYNDYGQGFYCTAHQELASQWACKSQSDGIVNEYVLDILDLKILYLDEKCNILNWLAILVDNREITGDTATANAKFVLENYMIDYKHYDVIIGYRADDAYFRIVREFLNNTIGIQTLDEAMYLGELGLQVFLQSEKAFQSIKFVRSFVVDQETNYINSVKMVEKATNRYEHLKRDHELDDIFIRDLRRGGINENSIPKIKIK